MKVDAPTLFPSMCITCGGQNGPLVDTAVNKPVGVGGDFRVYLCRRCTAQAARTLGMIKGDEHLRLQNAADELAQAEREIATRQEQVDTLTRTNGEREEKIGQLQAQIERQQAEITHFRATINAGIASMKDAVAA